MCLVMVAKKIKLKIKFSVKLQGNTTETFNKLTQAYGNQVPFWLDAFRWQKAFLVGEKLKDEPHSD